MSQEEIRRKYVQRLVAALSGEEDEFDVCGLGVEALRDEIVLERDYLLEQCDTQGVDERRWQKIVKFSKRFQK